MTDYVQLPNGSYFPLKEGETAREAMMAAREMYPDAFGALKQEAASPVQKEGLLSEFAAGAKNLLNIGKTGIGALTGDTTEAAQAGVERQKKLGEEYKSGLDFDKITGKFDQGEYLGAAKEALSQVPAAVASIAPSVGQEMGLAATGRIAGGALGSFAGPGGTLVGQQVGQYALPLVVNFVQALGSQAQEKVKAQVEAGEKPDVDALELAPYAAGNAALNLVGTKIAMPSIFKKAIGQKVAAEAGDETRQALLAEAAKIANRGTLNTIGRGIGGFAFGELPTEVLQDVVDRAAIGKPLADDEAIKQYRDTAFSMLLASPLGGGFGIQQRSQARDTVSKDEAQQQAAADIENRQLAEQESKAKAAAEAQAEADRKANPAYATQFLQDYEARLAEYKSIPLKKPGKDATFEERAIFAENKAKKAELGQQLEAATPEYRQLKAALPVVVTPTPVTPIPVQAQTDMFGGAAPIVPATPAPAAAVDYNEEVRVLTDKLDSIRAQAQAAKDPSQIVELGQQYTQIKTALDAASKRVSKPIEKQIELAQRKMQLALDEGDVDLAAKQAAKLVELQSQYTPKDKSQLDLDTFDKTALEPVKDTFSESKTAFRDRTYPRGERTANLQAVQSEEEEALQDRMNEEKYRAEAAARIAKQEEKTGLEIADMEKQAAMNQGRTEQYTLFGDEELRSEQRSGTGALSTNSRARLQAALQIARATGNRQGVADAVAALKDLKAKEEAGAAGDPDAFLDSAVVQRMTEATGQKMPANVAAQQEAADARDTAYANVVDLVSKFNQGKAKKEALDRARDFLIENLAKDIETSRGKPLTAAEQTQVRKQANELLNELVARFGDTRNTSSVGTKLDQAFQPAQNEDGTFNTEAVPGMGFFTAEPKGPGYRTFASPYAAAMSIQEGLDSIRNKGVQGQLGATTVEAKTTPKTTTPDMVMDQLNRLLSQAPEKTDPEVRKTAIQIADNLKALGDNLDAVSEYLSNPTPERTREVNAILATSELGKRSETEGGKTAIQEDLPGIEATGTKFATAKEFDEYLASDALAQIRKDQGIVTQTVSRLKAIAAPFAKKAEGLRAQLAGLQAKYAAVQKVSADEVDLAKSMSTEAKANLKAVIDRLQAELWQHQEAYIQANISFNFAVKNSEEISANIEANARDYTEPQRKALSDYRKAKRALANAAKLGPTPDHPKAKVQTWAFERGPKERYAAKLASLQVEVVRATQAYRAAVARSQTQQAVTKFLDADLNLQMQLQNELAEMDRAGEELLNAGVALELAKQKQDRSYKNKAAIKQATSDVNAALQMETEAIAAAEAKKTAAQADIAATAKELADAEREANKADTVAERQRKQRERDNAALYTETIYDREERDRQLRRLENEARERLANIPGQRLDFSKRREMLDVVDSSRETEAEINQNIDDAQQALDQIAKNIELQKDAIASAEAVIAVLKPKKRLGSRQQAELDRAEQNLEDATKALEKSNEHKNLFEGVITRSNRAIARLSERVEEINDAFSNDPDVAAKIKKSVNGRISTRRGKIAGLSQKLNGLRDNEKNKEARTKIRHELAKLKREVRSLERLVETNRGLVRTTVGVTPDTASRLYDIAANTALPDAVRDAAQAKITEYEEKIEAESLTAQPKTTKEDESQEAVDARSALSKRKRGPVVKDIRTGKTSQAGAVKGPTGKQAVKQTVKGDELRQAFARIEELEDLYDRTEKALARATDPVKIEKFKANLEKIVAAQQRAEKITEGFVPIGVGTDATEATSSVQTLLNEEGQEALADGRTLDVLRNIIATTDVPFIRENAEKLLAFVSRTRIMYSPDITVNGVAVPAAYNAQENAVGVRPGQESESNVIHELTHAATMRALEGPEEKLNADQLAAKREITGIYNRLKADGTLTGQYAAKNVKEFVSEVQSNVDLRKKLGSVKMFGSTALRKIYDAIMRFIGMKPSYVKTEEAQAVIERLYMQSGKLANVETSPIVFSKAQPKYESENALTELANTVIAQPRSFKDRFVNNAALKAEMEAVDMRAGLREALKTGDTKNFQQAMYSVTKADQKMAMTYSALQNGAPELYTDEKGFHGVKSERRGNKPTAVNIFEAVSRVPGENEQAKMALATTYMIAQRAANKGLTKLDLGNLGVTEEKLAKAMAFVNSNAEYKNALETVREKYNAYNAGLIKFLADTGAIPKKMAEDFLKDGDYVPYYRVREDGVAELVFGGEKTVTIGDIRHQPYLAELKGGDTKILPLNESLPRNTMLLMDKALTNMATKNVAYALQDIGKDKGPIDEKTGKPKNLMPIHSGRNPGGPNVIVFNQEPDPKDPKDDGQRWLRVNTDGTIMGGIPAELVVKSLEGAHLTLPAFLKLGGIAGDLLRSGVTRTPLYIMRQLVRDPMAATFTSGLNYGPLSAIYKATKEFVKMQAGNSTTAAKLIEKGLIQSQIFNGDPDDLSKFALQLASGKDQGALDSLLAMADRAAMSADAATRALVYENAIANGLSEVEADMMVMESMNFNKRGLSPTVQYASRLIPFFNAQIQGLNVLYKAATGKMPYEEQQRIKQKFYNNGMMLMATGLVYAMAMQDDEYYKNAKPKDRYSNFFLHIPGVKEPLKIPIPYEAGWFFSAAVATVDAMVSEVDTKQQLTALKDMILGSVPGYSSMGVPQIAKPAFEVWTNKNFFSGNNIESMGMQNKRTEDRYVASTTEMAKAMSRAFPVLSPVQIEHLVRGYLGVMPIAAAAAANDLFTKESAVAKPEGRLTDMPLVGSAFQKQYGGADADVVYKLAQEVMETNTSFNSLKKTGTQEDIRAFREEHKAELRAASLAGAFKQNMARLKLQEELITNRMPLTPEEKRARIDKIDKARQETAERFMKRIKEIESQS